MGMSKSMEKIRDEGPTSHLVNIEFYFEWEDKERWGLIDVFKKHIGCWAKNKQEPRAEIKNT